MTTLFEARAVGRAFANGTVALDGVDMVIGRGDFAALVGPSGCGKSTLLRLIAGLDDPTTGAVAWPEGRPEKGDIGFVFQEPTLMPWASVRDNIWLPLRLAGVSRGDAEAKIAEVIRLVGLDGFEHAYPRQLSGGMRMRVSIARALITKPGLLLLDEPFAALDEQTRFRLNEDLLRIWQAERCTVLFVTHSVFEAVFLSQRAVVMTPRPGRVAADLAIDLAYPREPALRTSGAYAEICRTVSDRLAEAMA